MRGITAIGVGLIAALGVRAEMAPEQQRYLGQAFEALCQDEDVRAAGYVMDVLADPGVSDADWEGFLMSYAQQGGMFTPALARFWEFAAGSAAPARQQRTTFLSAACAGAALGGQLAARDKPAEAAACVPALTWLDRCAPLLSARSRGNVLAVLKKVAGDSPVGLLPMLQPTPGGGRGGQLGMQLCLTVGRYLPDGAAGRQQFEKVLRMPGRMGRFWHAHGIFLFDNGKLNAEQYADLDTLFGSVPTALHAIVALIVPEAMGLVGDQPDLMSPGQFVVVGPVPMDRMSNPDEFTPHVGQPVAPVFTLAVAQQVVRAIQEVQFERRPELAVRRDAILHRARGVRERYLRRLVSPEVYRREPDEFLPKAAYLWFIDTSTAFRSAIAQFELGHHEPMDTFLLMADLLSNRETVTPAFSRNAAGVLTGGKATVERFASAEIDYITGIEMSDTFWTFTLNDAGSVVKVRRGR